MFDYVQTMSERIATTKKTRTNNSWILAWGQDTKSKCKSQSFLYLIKEQVGFKIKTQYQYCTSKDEIYINLTSMYKFL